MTTEAYEALRRKGLALAGDASHLTRRVNLYRHMYEDSGKRNVFPLIAAHVGLSAAGMLRLGMFGARAASLAYLGRAAVRARKLEMMEVFADRFRHINRQVCAEAYALYYYSRDYGVSCSLRARIGDALADALCMCHTAVRSGTPFSRQMREQMFLAFFRWEQDHIVEPALVTAFAGLDWPLIRFFALRPHIHFAYFGVGFSLQFRDFSRKEERLARGMLAYRRAEDVGLARVERALAAYRAAAPVQEHRCRGRRALAVMGIGALQ